jgi:hypothetical protein
MFMGKHGCTGKVNPVYPSNFIAGDIIKSKYADKRQQAISKFSTQVS